MYTLGLSIFGQNPAACLLKDNQIIAFVEEERYVRVKSAAGYFPINSIKYCLKNAQIKLDQIDAVAVGWDYSQYRIHMPFQLGISWLKNPGKGSANATARVASELINLQPNVIKERIKLELQQISFTHKIPQINFVSHHLSHATSSYFFSGFKNAYVVVIDGSGEQYTTSIYRGEAGKIRAIRRDKIPNSLGWFYASISAYLGFIPYQEDGFLMGLAPYGTYKSSLADKFSQILELKDNTYHLNSKYTLLGKHTYSEHFSDQLVDLLGKPRHKTDAISQRHKDIAYMAQEFLERAVMSLVESLDTKPFNLCLAGGVALNCKLNGKLLRMSKVNQLFVQPVSSDAGSALGAAAMVAHSKGKQFTQQIKHMYWGPEYSNQDIKSILATSKVKATKVTNISKLAAKAIHQGKIIGWFQGRSEAGPRALGNRSILANPTITSMKKKVNDRVKFRDMWRPFCPSILDIDVKEYYQGSLESKYMIVAYQFKKESQTKIPAVIHVDGSARPQMVVKNDNPKYYSLIKHLKQLNGRGVVLNTSLNVKGEPICLTPQDALRCFFSCGLDAMAIGDYWLEK